MLASGVYSIRNRNDGKEYIGSAVSFRYRWNKHRSELNRGCHSNPKLMRAWKKHGPDAFEFKMLLVCSRADLIFFEQRAIDRFRPAYNLAPVAGSLLGFKRPTFTQEHRAKISASRKGLPGAVWSPEQRAAARATKLQYFAEHGAPKLGPQSAETRAKISAALTGLSRSEAFKQKASEIKKAAFAQRPELRELCREAGRRGAAARWKGGTP